MRRSLSRKCWMRSLPLAIDAALQLIADRERAGAERRRQSELALQQARYEETMLRAGNMTQLIS